MTFTFADPMQLWLPLSTDIQTAAWQHSQIISPSGGRWQTYLNQLCLRAFIDWLQSEQESSVSAWPPIEAIPTSWELVNGSVVSLDETRLALIPKDGIGHDELEVPQEWVDISDWATDYYLAVQINAEDGWLECWGYITHEKLKTLSNYDAMERIYSVGAEELSHDVSALWVTLAFCPTAETQTDLDPFPQLSETQAETLIEQLTGATFPRLFVPFSQWGALLTDGSWRQRLWTQRLAAVSASARPTLSQYLQRMQAEILQKRDWTIADGWQSVEAVFGTQSQQMAFSFREAEQTTGMQAKAIQINQATVRLVLLWQLESDSRLAIRVQLYPPEGALYLPPDIRLSLVSEEDEVLQSIRSEAENNYIQLKRFRCPAAYAFGIEVELNRQKTTERFVA